jgi:hypothetical protein
LLADPGVLLEPEVLLSATGGWPGVMRRVALPLMRAATRTTRTMNHWKEQWKMTLAAATQVSSTTD